jgi:hypothetical protein
MRSPTPARFALPILVTLTLLLGGCATASNSKTKESEMKTPAQSRAEIYDLYVATRNLLGGTWSGAENSWFECNLAVDRRDQDVVGGPVAVAHEVGSLWAERGYKAKLGEDKTLTPPLYALSDPPFLSGSGPDGFLIQLTLKGDVVRFTGTGRCVSGDIEKLNLGEPKIPNWTGPATPATH